MKNKIIIALILTAIAAGAVWAAAPTEEDYNRLGELRAQMVRMKQEMDKFMDNDFLLIFERLVSQQQRRFFIF